MREMLAPLPLTPSSAEVGLSQRPNTPKMTAAPTPKKTMAYKSNRG